MAVGLKPGRYVLIASTFRPGELSAIALTTVATYPVTVTELTASSRPKPAARAPARVVSSVHRVEPAKPKPRVVSPHRGRGGRGGAQEAKSGRMTRSQLNTMSYMGLKKWIIAQGG